MSGLMERLAEYRKRALLGIFALGMVVACGGSQASGDVGSEGPQGGQQTLAELTAELQSAPDFQVSTYQGDALLGGGELQLSDLFGQPIVLNFWAGLCPPCRAEMPDLQAFHNEFGDRIILLGLDVGPFFRALGSREDARDLLEELGITYPAGTTLDENVVRQYRVLSMPTTFFITADGKIFRKWPGLLNQKKISEIAEDLLALHDSAVAMPEGAPAGT